MQPKWTRRLGLAGLVGAIVYASVGCAQERPAINQVQPNALSKHFFVGADLSDPSDDPQFYMRNTVIDIPYGADQEGLFTASYAQPLSRVRWEIDENVLIARLTYDRIQNTGPEATAAETQGVFPPDGTGSVATTSGQVVAMFNITSQFDIRRSYNPQTGEEYNVIVENSTDRPWYQREYMRVDWSKNLITDGYDFDTLSQIGIFGGVKFDPESYEVTDPNDPNAPAFDMDTGYFDITTKAFATPNTVDTPWGTFPACFLPGDYGGGYPVTNCSPTEVTLRLSFKRVVDNDFEPTDWDGNRMAAFGWFTEDRFGYDRNYGTVLDQNWHRYAAKYNFWQQSHITGSQCAVDYYRDAQGNVQKYQTDGAGNFLTDATTGLPILANPGDPNGQPYPSTPAGADPHRLASDGKTEAECAFSATDANGDTTVVHPGAYCDVTMNKCALPLRERHFRTIPWYYGPGAPSDLFAATGRALDQWNIAVKRAAVIGQMADAKRVGIDPTYLIQSADASQTLPVDPNNNYPTEDGFKADKAPGGTHIIPDIFTLCHNPVIDSDDPSCGPAGTVARVGDIRYNMVNIIQTPQTGSPWGIMVDANDPLTGEKVQTSVNEWGAVLDYAAQATEDLLRWIDGEITDQQIVDGQYMQAWVNASKLGTGSYQGKTLSQDDIKHRLASIDNTLAAGNGLTTADASSPRIIQRLKASTNLAAASGNVSANSQYESFRQSMIGTSFETALVTPHMLELAGMDPTTPVAGNDSIINQASLLRGMNPRLTKWIANQKSAMFAANGYCSVDQPEPDALVGMARMAQKLYPLPASNDPNYAALLLQRNQSLHQWIREQFHVSVIAHEMGHSMGLRHNFTGSVDSLNYKPQYWQLRTRNGAEKACPASSVTTPNTDGTICVGPRWMDPVTEQEVNGLIWKWGSTTVMDYPGDQTQDMNDIGSYDKAAMRFCYGQTVDVDTDAFSTTGTKGTDYIQVGDEFGGIAGVSLGGHHYSTYNDNYHILNNCTAPTDPNDLTTATCDGFKMDFVPMRDMLTVPQYGPQYLAARPDLVRYWEVDPATHHVRHPYMFGSDEYADFGNVPVFRFDAGADAYEQIQFISSVYENRYIFDNFRRNRTTFSSLGTINRINSRYWDKIQSMVKTLGLMVELSSNPAADEADPGQLMPLALGAPDVMLTFMRAITRPEPGPYEIQAPAPTQNQFSPFSTTSLDIQIQNPTGDFLIPVGSGNGRFIENDYDYTQGYWWGDYQTKAGSWAEKISASYYLNEAYNDFISNSEEDYIDGRYKNLNFASLYPNQVRRFQTQIMAGDPMTLAPYVTVPVAQLGSAQPAVQYLNWDQYDANTPLTYPTGATLLDPLVGWEDQYPALFVTWWFGSTNLKSDTMDQMRIWSPGDLGTADIDASDVNVFRDPISGLVYAARTYGTEKINTDTPYMVEQTIGARMLQYAQLLSDQAYGTAQRTTTTDPVYGKTVYQYANTGAPVDAAAAAKLAGYISNLDTARRIAKYILD
jgi:hypothetical protein